MPIKKHLLAGLLLAGCAAGKPAAPSREAPACRCKPGEPCWPSAAEWQRLGANLDGSLERVQPPLSACGADAAGAACAAALRQSKNPFQIQERPEGTQSTGWLSAWSAAPSEYAVAAESSADVAAAIDFARRRGLRLVVKGTGHDYLGRSNAPDSLLVWTHKMRRIDMHDAFVPSGCPTTQPGAPAVTAFAGTRWLEVYQEVTVKHGRYVQGGGCTSVGAAGGFTQGGGFGSWSKKYGTAAANVLEAEVVTADGKVRVANACQHQDLFWALRGGGGGTFGVVTRVTFRTHALPTYFGLTFGRVTAASNAAFAELLERFLAFYAESLENEHWGEQVKVKGDNSLDLAMAFQGMSAAEAEKQWRPFRDWVDERRDRFAMKVNHLEVPGGKMWNREYILQRLPQAIVPDEGPDRPGGLYWWADNQNEVSAYWHAYQSRWVPSGALRAANVRAFASSLFEASRHWPIELHFNKGLAGASVDALSRGRETSTNPAAYRAAALAIAAASGAGHPGVPGREPGAARAEADKAKVTAAMAIVRAATPGAGTYVNESDYFEPDWQQAFWGEHYSRLLAIKQKYDEGGLFFCHHCVGSESWSGDGRCRAQAAKARPAR